MTSKTMCILFSESYGTAPEALSAQRTLATVPFAGRYRLIDFVLSSLVQARIRDIDVITKEHYGSLTDHLGWGKDWDLDRKNGGLRILTPFTKSESANTRNRSKIEALLSVKRFIERSDMKYVILSDTNLVMHIDFEKMLAYHADSGADITMLYQTKVWPNHTGCVIDVDESGHVIDAYFSNTKHEEPQNAAFGVYVINKDLLVSLLDRAYTFGWVDFERDFITKNIDKLKIFGFAHQGFSAVIDTVEDYYDASMKMLEPGIRHEMLFQDDIPLLTRVKNSVPTIYGFNGKVCNSLIADGCKIDGEVNNCIIFRDVEIEKGALLNNCIIMQSTIVRAGARLNCVITDKEVIIGKEHTLSGRPNYPYVVAKGQNV